MGVLPPLTDLENKNELQSSHGISSSIVAVIPGRVLLGNNLDIHEVTEKCDIQEVQDGLCEIEEVAEPVDLPALRSNVDDLEKRVRAGEVLLISTSDGDKGGAYVAGACLLSKLYELGADEAIGRMQSYASLLADEHIMSDVQKDKVRNFVRVSRASDCAED
jgi:hypothetical protein